MSVPQAPKDVTKRKLGDLSSRQFKILLAALKNSRNSQAQALGERLARNDVRGFKAPHFLRHIHADGTSRSYVVSRTWARGTYGKFRHVLRLGPTHQHLAAKDFRSSSRFSNDMDKIYKRLEATNLENDELERLAYHPRAVAHLLANQTITQAQAQLIESRPSAADSLVLDGTITADQGRSILLNEDYLRHLVLTKRLTPQEKKAVLLTRFVEVPAVANEYELVARAKSPLAAIDKILVDGRILMITEVMDGELQVANLLPPNQSRALVRYVLARVGEHMAQSHAMGVVHRDLKPENILFDLISQNLVPSDFGLGAPLVDGQAKGCVGTPGFAAPELLRNERYTMAVDVFSLGMVAASMALRGDLMPGHGRAMLDAMVDFERVRNLCPKRADGMCDLSRIGPNVDDIDSMRAFASYPEEERAIRLNLHAWYKQDPELATYVFTKMLAIDPAQRDSMAQVAVRFEADPQVVNTTLAKFVPHDRVAGELAIMEAFGAAYLAEEA